RSEASAPLVVHRGRRLVRAIVAIAGLAIGAGLALAAPRGRVGPRYRTTGNGRRLRPAGRLTRVGDFPTGAALTPDGRFYWVVNSGHGRDDVRIVNVATGRVIQVLP